MKLPFCRIIAASLGQFLALMFCAATVAPQQAVRISTPEDIEVDLSSAPCKNEERLPAVRALFEKMGAAPTDMSLEKYKGVENLVVSIKGSSLETIVLGAHYDKVSDGCGAIDNWTGIVAIAHLYQTLRNTSPGKTIIFVAFGKEEKGLVGSRAMVDAIAKEQRALYCAMINVDSLGLASPQVLDNTSSKKLAVLAEDVATELKIPFSHVRLVNADADSSSFVGKKIPALTIIGLTNDWHSIIHSRNDQVSKVNPVSVYLGYRLALAMVSRLDGSSCAAYR